MGARRRWEHVVPYGFVAPFYVLFAAFGLFPLGYGFYISLYHWNGLAPPQFVGLRNYSVLMSDPVFWHAVENTLVIACLATTSTLLLALLLAFVLARHVRRFQTLYLALLFAPVIMAAPAAAILARAMFDKNLGLVNAALGGMGIPAVNWLGSPLPMKGALALLMIWRWLGYNTVIYYGGLQAIPEEYYEVAAIDGARSLQVLRFVTVPQLRRVILFTTVISTIGVIQLFTEPYLLASGTGGVTAGTSGGVGASLLTGTMYVYSTAFQNFDFGYAAAISYALVLISLLAVIVNLLIARSRAAR